MATKAKLDANKRYLEKQDSALIRFPKGQKEEIAAFAKNVRGKKSLNAYVVDLINADMQKQDNDK